MRAWEENGAYLVMGSDGPPSGGALGKLLPEMIGCTFPVTGDPGLMAALCPGYRSVSYQHHLVTRYGGAKYRFLFLPRHLYVLLYHAFVTTVEKGSNGEGLTGKITALQAQDARMLLAFKKTGSLVSYFAGCVEEMLGHSAHFAAFNDWALTFISSEGCLPDLLPDRINHVVPKNLLGLVEPLVKLVGLGPAHTMAFLKLIDLEVARPECTFLTRFGSSSDVFITMKDKKAVKPGAESFSQSFGADLVAGYFGDLHANTLVHIGGESACLALPIHIDDYRSSRRLASCFWIPPYPTPCQCYAGMNELWHPRSRIVVRKDVPLSSQEVRGITEYGIQVVNRDWAGEIEVLPFMFFPEVLPDDQIILLSIEVEAYIRKNAIEICPAQKK